MRRLVLVEALWVLFLGVLCVSGLAQEESLGYINGLVYDVEGAPVTDALVLAHGVTPEGEIAELEGTVDSDVTDGAGSYELTVLPGSYRISVKAEGYVSRTVSLEVYEGMTFAEPMVLVREAKISGTVLGSDGVTPVPEAAVWAVAEDGTLHIDQADASGAFTLAGLPAGSYSISALAGAESASEHSVSVMAGEAVKGISMVLVSVAAASPVHADGGGISGFVLQPDGTTPVAAARIALLDADGNAVERVFEATDGVGAFAADGLAAGTYDIIATAAGYASVHVRGVDVAAGAQSDGVDVVLPLPYGCIRGFVVAENGSPISEAMVIAAGDGWSQGAISDNEGAFALPHLPEGTAVVSAIAEGYEVASVEDAAVVSCDSAVAVELILAVEGGS